MTVNEDILIRCQKDGNYHYRIYEPQSVSIVLGAGRKNKGDIIEPNAALDNIPILQRKGGGGTVVLSPGMIILSLAKVVESPFQNHRYAITINSWFKEVLHFFGVKNLEDKGIADLALSNKKILGTSIFRRKKILFYQASLLVSNDLSLFSRYLNFPSDVPDYRAGRSHEDFCITLYKAGYRTGIKELSQKLNKIVTVRLPGFY
jgi:lipoate-protein ligase A